MREHSSFDSMFAPRAIAVIGATDREGTVGRTLLSNLAQGACRKSLYAVNPKHEQILGISCHKDIASVPAKVDLAVIATPAPTVPGIIGDCVRAGVRAAVVISAGFKERGAEGAALEEQIRQQLRGSRLRVVGPNCLGIMNPLAGINATFAHDMALPGKVAFLSQSGALETAILDWSLKEGVGFSAIVSTGSMLDVGWGDLIDYFGEDERTNSILLYLESVGDARSFLSAVRQVALQKPVIVIKAGRSDVASRAATSHTGALTGNDEVFDAAVRRCGALRVDSISDLFDMAKTFDRQPRPQGPRLMIVTNAGGPGVLATDAIVANGAEVATLSDSSTRQLNEFLSPNWSHANPIDILGDAGPEEYGRALKIALSDPNTDGLLAILAPQGMTDPVRAAQALIPIAHTSNKPILACWMGGKIVDPGTQVLNQSGVATFSYPDAAARAFCYMWRHTYNLRGIYETPSFAEEIREGDKACESVLAILAKARMSSRMLLSEAESKDVLRLYGIPTVETKIARSEDEAAMLARAIGYPCVLKLYSDTITHKTDVGGIKLDLSSEPNVRRAYRDIESAVSAKTGAGKFQGVTVQPMIRQQGYELILGSSVDPQFGPVILFGMGGQLVEVFGDRALGLPPLNATLAQRLMEQTKVYKALKGVRGRTPVNLHLLESILVRFSRLVVEQPWIKEIDVNPLLASTDMIVALDARIVLHPASTAAKDLPRTAVRPYPNQYVRRWTTHSGRSVIIRPIRAEDEPLMVKFHESLSRTSVYQRYFHMMSLDARISHGRLAQQCFIDYDREMALVVDYETEPGQRNIIAVGRLTKTREEPEAEVAIIVADAYQRDGIGTELMSRLIQIGRGEKLEKLFAIVLPDNDGLLSIGQKFDFEPGPSFDTTQLTVYCDLTKAASAQVLSPTSKS